MVNVVAMKPDDKVAAVIDTRDYETYRYLLIATKRGMVKKTLFREYDSSRREGIIALNLKDGDEVVRVAPTAGDDDVLLISKKGKAIRFKEEQCATHGTHGDRGHRDQTRPGRRSGCVRCGEAMTRQSCSS